MDAPSREKVAAFPLKLGWEDITLKFIKHDLGDLSLIPWTVYGSACQALNGPAGLGLTPARLSLSVFLG